MNLNEIAAQLGLENLTPEAPIDASRQIQYGYVSDLLSDVLAHAPRDGVLVTIQVHLNVVAVAAHAELAAVVFVSGRRPEEAVLQKAAGEGIALYSTENSAFDIAGRFVPAWPERNPCVKRSPEDLHVHEGRRRCRA